MSIRFFLDSADVDEWSEFAARGWFHGITTNPLLLADSGLPQRIGTAKRLLRSAAMLPILDFQFQTWGQDAETMYTNGMSLAALSKELTIKVPATFDGMAAAAALKKQEVRVTMTACFTLSQCAAACALSAEYIAPYYGRMLDQTDNADDTIDAMLQLCQPTGTRVLVASIRSIDQLEALLRRGFDTFTLRADICNQIMKSDLTAQAVEAFNRTN